MGETPYFVRSKSLGGWLATAGSHTKENYAQLGSSK